MSDGLDFSDLSDDQIVELASALAHEALLRNPAVAAAFKQALLTEKERAEAAMRGARAGKARLIQEVEGIHQRAAEEQAREELRQRQHAAISTFVRQGALIVGRAISDVTLVWSNDYGHGHHLYLNAGVSTETVGALHLVDYFPNTESIRVSWALESRKGDLLQWCRETTSAMRTLKLSSVTFKGIDL